MHKNLISTTFWLIYFFNPYLAVEIEPEETEDFLLF